MALGPHLHVTFESLSNPEGMIGKANANIRRVRPKVSDTVGSTSTGTVESGDVIIDTTPSAELVHLRKKKKTKNTHKTKRKKQKKQKKR